MLQITGSTPPPGSATVFGLAHLVEKDLTKSYHGRKKDYDDDNHMKKKLSKIFNFPKTSLGQNIIKTGFYVIVNEDIH